MHEVPTEIVEHREHAEHAAHAHDAFISRVSITIALLAVMTALAGSLETVEDGASITAASKAVLAQDKATDSWSFYQAKSVKKRLDTMAAEQRGTSAADYEAKARREAAEEAGIASAARKDEAERDRWLERSEAHEDRHHRLLAATTLLEMGIAIATIAIITHRRSPWLGSVALGCLGVAIGAWALWP